MKKIILIVTFLLSISFLSAQKIAILDFKAGVGINQYDVDGLSATFVTYFNPRGYQIVERMQIDKVLREQGFQQSSLTESQMVRLGQIMNLTKIVVGDVNIVGGHPNLDVRVVDVQSGLVTGRDGATFSWTNYRPTVQQLAQRVAGQIGISYSGGGGNSVNSQTSGKSPSGKVETILGYVQVYPEDIGTFSEIPSSIIAALNRQKMYGYNDWRLPAKEELSLMATAKAKLGMASIDSYMCKENSNSSGNYIVRLVRVVDFDRGNDNGHEYIDLGLPSGLLWASSNVGANTEKDYGDYYSWGETKTKSCYDDENYNLTAIVNKYKINSILKKEDDAATVNWGQGWRIPTNNEWKELMSMCSWSWLSSGYKVTGPNGNSIFLPAAGLIRGRKERISNYEGKGCYLSASFDDNGMCGFVFDKIDGRIDNINPRVGWSVRAVFQR